MSKIYVGLDVSLEMTSICPVDAAGRAFLEAGALSNPGSIARVPGDLRGPFERAGLEADPMSQWLNFGLIEADYPAVCMKTRSVKAAMGAMSMNKNHRNGTRALAQAVRSGWFKVVHVKSVDSQELRALLVTREFLVNKVRDHKNGIRGVLRPFGLKIGRLSAGEFETRVREPCGGSPRLLMCIDALLRAGAVLREQLWRLHFELLRVVWNGELCRRFRTIPGVGPVTALAFKTTIDRPERFRRSSDVGPHPGLTPRQCQSGETARRGKISRCGDGFTRTALLAAANLMLSRSRQWTVLKAWGMRRAQRNSLKKAKIAAARKLAVVMRRM